MYSILHIQIIFIPIEGKKYLGKNENHKSILNSTR